MSAWRGKGQQNNELSSSNDEDDGMIREGGSDEQREIQMQQNLITVDGVTLFPGSATANDSQIHACSHQVSQQPHASKRNQQETNHAKNVQTDHINSQPTSLHHGSEVAARIENNQQKTDAISKMDGRKMSSQPTSTHGSADNAKISEARRIQFLEYERLHQAHMKSKNLESKPAARVIDNPIRSHSTPSLTNSNETVADSAGGGNNTPPIMNYTDSPALQAQIRAYEQLNQAHLRRSMSHINNSSSSSGYKSRHSSSRSSQSARSLNALEGMDHSNASFSTQRSNCLSTHGNNRNALESLPMPESDWLRQDRDVVGMSGIDQQKNQTLQSQSARSFGGIAEMSVSASRALDAQKLEYERLHQARAKEQQNRNEGLEYSNANNQQEASSMAMDDDDSGDGSDEYSDRKAPF